MPIRSVRTTSFGMTRAKRKASARMSGRRSSSARGRVLLSGLSKVVTTRNAFSDLRAVMRRAAAGLSLWLTTATLIPLGPGSGALTRKIWPKRKMRAKGMTKARMSDARSRKKRAKSFLRRTRMAFMLFAKDSAGQLEEEGFEGGALAGEEARGEAVGLGQRVEGAQG